MGIKKHRRPGGAPKDRNKRADFRNRRDIKPQISKFRITNKKRIEMSSLSNGARYLESKPLLKLLDRRGMKYGRDCILRTVRNDYQLRRDFYKFGIRNKSGLEEALLQLLFECRNLKDWESGGDNLVDVFHLIKGRVEWASNCSVDLVMQLFFALLRARLGCRASSRKNACKVALRVDKVISVSNPKELHFRSRVVH